MARPRKAPVKTTYQKVERRVKNQNGKAWLVPMGKPHAPVPTILDCEHPGGQRKLLATKSDGSKWQMTACNVCGEVFINGKQVPMSEKACVYPEFQEEEDAEDEGKEAEDKGKRGNAKRG